MVEMDFPFPDERVGFDTFYADHISLLLSIEGFLSAQRFEADRSVPAPFLAIYEIANPEVLTSPAYASKAGPAAVPNVYRSKFRNRDRNVFTTPSCELTVPMGGWMTVVDRLSTTSMNLPVGYTALNPTGLDRSVVERGIRIHRTGESTAPAISASTQPKWHVRTMKPLHDVRTSNNRARRV